MPENKNAPELLAPAGSAESAAAAIAAGADAIYFGGERFSARARAKNLSYAEIADCLRECRARGIKAYGAVNTRLRDSELSDTVECAWEMLSAGADALIVADLGAAALIRQAFPEAVLHASTQITGTSSADAEALAALGFSRMVCPRELTLEELRILAEVSPIGIEMFIHGAHCVSVSGQCSMSYVMGGRSGNRGDCAGPCRLPFGAGLGQCRDRSKPRDFALSLKDMCLGGHVRELINSGVESFKIEGRLKGPEYTYGVVSIYRTLIDERRDATPDEMERLAGYFSRDGFSDGYLTGKYSHMLGTKKDSEIRQDKAVLVPPPPKVPITGELRLYCGEPSALTLRSPMGEARVSGDVLSAAVGVPPSEESLTRSISKLGHTPFVLESLTVDTDGVCGVSASALNSLRREACEKLTAPPQIKRSAPAESELSPVPTEAVRAALLYSADQLTEAVAEYFDEIYIPTEDFVSGIDKLPEKACLSLPDVMYEGMQDRTDVAVKLAAAKGRRVLVHTLGELKMARDAGAAVVCSHRFVVYNSRTAAELRLSGAESVTLSPEVSTGAARAISRVSPVTVLTGGRMPLMLCRRCPMSDGGRTCKSGRVGGYDGKLKSSVCRGYLKDRTGAPLPAVGDRYCMTTVFNSVPTWTDMNKAEAAEAGITRMMHVFSAEAPRECDEAVAMLKGGEPPAEYRRLR